LEALNVVEIYFVFVVLSIFQNILDKIVPILNFENDVVVAVGHGVELDGAEIFVLLTYHKLHDVADDADLLENFGGALVEDVENSFSDDEEDAGDGRVLLDDGDRKELSADVANVSVS